MANANILAKKQEVIDEVKAKTSEATTVVLFDYRGLTDNESKELRVKLREVAYGNDAIAPIKVLADFAKNHPALVLKVGIVDGEISDKEKLSKLAKLPSRDTLLTQLAGALIAIPKDLAIGLDLYAKQKEEN